MPTTQELLTEARAAYHALMTGTAVVEVRDQNGEIVKYQPASILRLAAYIQTLEALLAGRTAASGPMQVWF